MEKKRITLISTGGTIEKTYDELEGVLENQVSVLDVMLSSLQLRGVTIDRVALMNKDSLDMTPEDHALIAERAAQLSQDYDGVVIVHGTDRLTRTGEAIHAHDVLNAPVVLTGAMRPYELRNTDALQNLTEALIAVQLLEIGVYIAIHNRVLRFPGITKDRVARTFVYDPPRDD